MAMFRRKQFPVASQRNTWQKLKFHNIESNRGKKMATSKKRVTRILVEAYTLFTPHVIYFQIRRIAHQKTYRRAD